MSIIFEVPVHNDYDIGLQRRHRLVNEQTERRTIYDAINALRTAAHRAVKNASLTMEVCKNSTVLVAYFSVSSVT